MGQSVDQQDSMKAGRGHITKDARRRGADAKIMRGVFNRYLKLINGPQVDRIHTQIQEIDQLLERGTRLKKAPVFEAGHRVGTIEKELPLLPSEKAIWMAKRLKLRASLQDRAPEELRAEFLRILPIYAARHGLTREILEAVGVPVRDLDAAGVES